MNGTCRNFPVAYWSGASPEGEPETEPPATPATMVNVIKIQQSFYRL